jgi:oligo-1,6-glucosidase
VGGGADPVAVLEALREGSRDNARSPVQWDASPHAGFTTGEPWFPVNPNHDEVNAEHALADPDSVFHHYRRLIELRHTDLAVSDGRFALLLPEHPTLWAFTRTLGEEALLVVANLSGDPLAMPDLGEPGWAGAALVLGTHPDTPATHADDAVLRPWEARVLRRA